MPKRDERAQRNAWSKRHRENVKARKGSPAVPKRTTTGSGKRPSPRFAAELERFVAAKEPVALARFHDGEFHMPAEIPDRARSGWRLYRPSWLKDRLGQALEADLDSYYVGISPPCDYPRGTSFFRSRVKTKRVTFATVFWHHNFLGFMGAVRSGALKDACIVSSGKGDVKVPKDGAVVPFDIDAVVERLLEEKRPILVAAGPCACVIVHEYWKRADPKSRQTILDVGAAIDQIVHGKNTRDFHDPGSALRMHECTFAHTVPWAHQKAKALKGWRGYLGRKKKA